MNQPLSAQPEPSAAADDWRHDRLSEARGVIADISQHPISLVILACRTIAAQSPDGVETAEAVALWRMLDPRPLHALAAAAFENGGAR
jgi:hypothetical protein